VTATPRVPVVRPAPAKLNLTLAVTGRRPDGYHDLHSVMVPLGLADLVSVDIAAGPGDTLHVAGPDTGPLASNLVLRAIALAREAVRGERPTPSLAARLEKHIPVAAGLGGGSSDGFAALEAAYAAWGADPDPATRLAIAARLGSDVPFFLAAGAALVEGRGERVTPLRGIVGAAPGILLVTPRAAVPTPAVFAALDAGGDGAPADRGSTRASSEHLAAELRAGLRSGDLVARAGVLAVANDLAAAADVVLPGLRQLRRALTRTLGRPVGLSGSGPTLWALYPSAGEAATAAELVESTLASGALVAPGGGTPRVHATTILARPDVAIEPVGGHADSQGSRP
jgi:4-diphosphocytidyl-2-C-methyl-D-erythritol kinase